MSDLVELNEVDLSAARKMRWSLLLLFGLFGVFATAWGGRAPSVREALNLSVGTLGTVIVVGALGSLISVSLSGVLVPRLGSRNSLIVGMVGSWLGLTTMSISLLTGIVPLFVLGILINGLSNPFTNVTSNLEGAHVEKLLNRPVLPQLHAAFPIGAAVGSGLAALSARTGINVGIHLIILATVATIGRAVLIGSATKLSAPPVKTAGAIKLPFGIGGKKNDAALTPDAPATVSAWREPRTVMLGVLLVAGAMSEGSAGNWLNLTVVESFNSPEEFGALAYATFVISMLTVRLLGAGLLERYGRIKVLYASGALAFIGLAVFTMSPVLPVAWIGIVLWGLGAAMVWPTVMGAAADDPARAAARVSVASSFSSVAMLVAPPLLGMLGDTWGLRYALMLILIPMVVAMFVTKAARPITGPTEILHTGAIPVVPLLTVDDVDAESSEIEEFELAVA